MLRLEKITKDYKVADMTVRALKGIDLSFRENEYVSILGPSGCGKTTLLNILGGLDKYTSGDLFIGGRSTKEFKDKDWDVYRNHRIGFIFQSYNLIPHQTVLGNVELALTIAGMSKAERQAKAKKALDKVGLSDQYNKRPNQLSGGQCQRVAIARALVNDPEILLADEPTGALDTTTSVQIMELVQEIAKEKLVIMVTHNPELAEKYSTRIIKLLDGELQSDSNPFTNEEEIKETNARNAEIAAKEQAEIAASPDKKIKKEKAKMSMWTAFKLSVQNLFTKKARTTLTSIAGSIGIIGVSLVLSVSYGVQSYINNMQNDMLSGNPITISESALDLTSLMQSGEIEQGDLDWEQGKVNVNSTISNLIKRSENMSNLMQSNEITQDYIDYVKKLPADKVSAIMLSYGLNLGSNIYTDFTPAARQATSSDKGNGTTETMSLSAIRAIYESILIDTKDYAQYATFISSLDEPFSQLPKEEEYILGNSDKKIKGQYNLVNADGITSRYATAENEVMLVLRKDKDGGFHFLSDLLLAQLGFYSQNEFMNMVFKSTVPEPGSPYLHEPSMDVTKFSYKDIMDREFIYYPNSVAFEKATTRYTTPVTPGANLIDDSSFHHRPLTKDFSQDEKDQGIKLKVVGILEPKDDLSYGTLSAGFFYTEALQEKIFALEEDTKSDIAQYMIDNGSISSQFQKNQKLAGQSEESDILQGATFQYSYVFPYDVANDTSQRIMYSAVGASNPFLSLASNLGGAVAGSTEGFGDAGLEMIMSGLSAKSLTLRSLTGRQAQKASIKTSTVMNQVGNTDMTTAKTKAVFLAGIEAAEAALKNAQSAQNDAQNDLMIAIATADPDMLDYIRAYYTAAGVVTQKRTALQTEWDKINNNLKYDVINDQHVFNADISLDGDASKNVKLIFTRTGNLVSAECNASDAGVRIGVAALYLDAAAGSTYSSLTTAPIISCNPIANNISIYNDNFEQKEYVLAYLDAWNSDSAIEFINSDGATVRIERADRADIKYSDFLSIIIEMISMFINIITIALVSFTSLSLVVSCVMIAIITYVSVVERTKEIGVIRSLGGRKRDVSYLFNAETIIIGLISGIIGIGFTYFASAIINVIVKSLTGIAIAKFPIHYAAIMVGVSVFLTFISGLIPSRSAAKKDPVVALRTE